MLSTHHHKKTTEDHKKTTEIAILYYLEILPMAVQLLELQVIFHGEL